MRLPQLFATALVLVEFSGLGLTSCLPSTNYSVNKENSHSSSGLEVTSTQLQEIALEEAEYFELIAFGNEFVTNPQTQYVRKWNEDIRIKVMGSPTQEDWQTLQIVINELNQLVGDIQIALDNQNHNLEIYFIPQEKFSQYEPNYVPGNLGFFFIWWNSNLEINRGKILISTNQVTQIERSHIIREELTQSLGLMNDAWTYPDSIFYQDWTEVNQFSELDKVVIRILYSPKIKTG
ncbi:MAG: DUF2927 domain-containing protein, partial [Spirulinaceae cyanobacterium]